MQSVIRARVALRSVAVSKRAFGSLQALCREERGSYERHDGNRSGGSGYTRNNQRYGNDRYQSGGNSRGRGSYSGNRGGNVSYNNKNRFSRGPRFNENDYENDKFVEREFPPLPELEDSQKVVKSGQVEDSTLHPDIKRAFIKNVGPTFTKCQEKSINHFINNPRGIIVRAQTGTGKTFAFGLPIFESLKEKSSKARELRGVDSIIFSPTRDLAVQMRNSLDKVWLNTKSNLRNNEIVLVTGKIPLHKQVRSFKGKSKPPIVVATPGRFIDLIQNEPDFINAMKDVSNVVIDEADELLNQNFKKDLETIFACLKEISNKQDNDVPFKTFLFSATMSNNVYELADNVIGEGYAFVDANEGETTEVNHNIKQSLVVTKSIFQSYASALQFIRSQMHKPDFKPLIFLPNTVSVDFFHDLLERYMRKQDHIPVRDLPQVLKIHGKLTQGERNYSQRVFRGDSRRPQKAILVGSNVVSRGMDFPDVSHVIQIGVNSDLSNYTHRVGRTGRAGKEGHSLLISTEFEIPFVKKLIEHGNSFEEELEYEPNTEEEQSIRDCATGMSFSSIAAANLGIYNNLPAKYGPIIKEKYVEGCSNLFKDLHADPASAENPRLSRSAATATGLDARMMRKYFDIDSHRNYDNEEEHDSYSSGYDRSSSNRGRGSYGSNSSGFSRGSNNRGGYSSNNRRRY